MNTYYSEYYPATNLSGVSFTAGYCNFFPLTALDEVINEGLVLLVDISAFGDVKLHGGAGSSIDVFLT